MLVRDRMYKDVAVISLTDSLSFARELMAQRKTRHLPVLSRGKLLGLISHSDLLRASPSPALTMEMGEVNYLLDRLPVELFMVGKVVTVAPSATLEEAARLMAENGIGCLPVVQGERLVGMITVTDILEAFSDPVPEEL